MPPRFAYWTILIDDTPTAFRAREREELLPTFHQLQRKNTNVTMQWFARGRLWASREAERDDFQKRKRAAAAPFDRAAKPPFGEKRGGDWRPGGTHKDPRDRFKKKNRPERAWSDSDVRRDRETLGPRSESRPWREKPPGPPRGDRPWQHKKAGGVPRGDRPWSTTSKPTGDRPRSDRPHGDRPWQKPKPVSGAPRAKRPWSTTSKPPMGAPRGDRPWQNKTPGGAPRGDRPWGTTNKPPAGAKRPWSGKPRGPRVEDRPGDRAPRKRRDDEPPDR